MSLCRNPKIPASNILAFDKPLPQGKGLGAEGWGGFDPWILILGIDLDPWILVLDIDLES